jgi:hypothetical protein
MKRSVLALGLALAASGAPAEEHPWLARFQGGSATIHEWGDSGPWAQAQVGRTFAGGRLCADVGLAFSSSDEGYGALTAGFEALPFPRSVVSPFVRGDIGFLGEPEYSGYVASVGGGLAVRLTGGSHCAGAPAGPPTATWTARRSTSGGCSSAGEPGASSVIFSEARGRQ